MKVLITSSRMPFALAMIRKLAEEGHTVFAADAYDLAPGSHSRYVARHFITGSPKGETERFIDDVERIVSENGIDLLLPAFEETFYLATQHDRLSAKTNLFAAPFATLARLHDKSEFQKLVTKLGVRTPETITVTSEDELREAIGRFPRYFARAAFSRGGVSLLTNTGPLAGHLSIDDVHPTPESPWLVQEFVDGPMVCTYSTAHDGRVAAHCTYRAPRQWEHSTAIQFLSIDSGPSLSIAQTILGELGYTGQASFDFVDTGDGLAMIECNPRATDGTMLMSSRQLSDGIFRPDGEVTAVEPGEELQLDLAVFGQMFKEGIRNVPGTLRDLIHIRGSDRGWHDTLPTLYSFLAFAHHERIALRERQQMFVAMAGDISWDGEPIAGMSDQDAALLESFDRDA